MTEHSRPPGLQAALAYARRGTMVFPLHNPVERKDGTLTCSCRVSAKCNSPAKHPRTKRGVHDATTDTETIHGWWRRWPKANVGVVCGHGVGVLDIDGPAALDRLVELEAEHGSLPDTMVVQTGREGGEHRYFKAPYGTETMDLAAGKSFDLKLRAIGHYVVGAGSLHISGRTYTAVDPDAQIAKVPGWLVTKSPATSRRRGRPAAGEADTPSLEATENEIREGARNVTFTSLAGSMRRDGFSVPAIEAALLRTNRERCRPPLDDSEVRQIAASIGRYEPAPEGSDTARASWPAPLREAAFQGLTGEIVRTIEPHSEADPAAVLVQLLTAFGSAVGRGPGFRVESDFHPTAMYVLLVGQTSSGRKGSSWGHVARLLHMVDPDWSRQCVRSGIASGEGLLHHVRDARIERRKAKTKEEKARADVDGYIVEEVDAGVQDKRLLAQESEFAQVLRVMGRAGNVVSPVLRGLWDRGRVGNLSKGSPETATDAHVSIIGHITAHELADQLDSTELANGFANRFLLVCVKRSKSLPRGGNLTDQTLAPLAARVRGALEAGRDRGLIDMSEPAGEMWDNGLYDDLTAERDDLTGVVLARGAAHVRRLAVVYAVLDQAPIVEVEHLRAALAVFDYCAASVARIFDGKIGNPISDRMLVTITDAGAEGITRTELRAIVGGRTPAARIDHALSLLAVRDLARVEHDPTEGRSIERWYVEGGEKGVPVEERSEAGALLHATPLSSTLHDAQALSDDEQRAERLEHDYPNLVTGAAIPDDEDAS